MATPGQLVHITAKALRLAEVTVGLHYRAIRDRGLVRKTGRGRSAPQVTALDASRLLIAIMGSRIVREAPDAVLTVGRYRQVTSEVDLNFPTLMPVDRLPDGHVFEDAVAKVLMDLARLTVSRGMVTQYLGLSASVDLADSTADLSLPDGSLHYIGRSPRYWIRQGLSETRTVRVDALARISRIVSVSGPEGVLRPAA